MLKILTKNLGKEGSRIAIPIIIIDSWTRLKVFLIMKLIGQTDTFTEALILKDEI